MQPKFSFQNLDVSIVLECKEMCWEGVDWIHLIQNRDQWQALVNTIMNLWIPKRRGIFD
jgi:hypothetical protein